MLYLIPVFVTSVNAQEYIIPDGSTDTHISIQEDDSLVIDIAAPDADRVSINNYDVFNVPEAGVVVDNTEDAARTIVHDVTGTGVSNIDGSLEILGTHAHTIIANQNGINLNGAQFINTADLILTTGEISRTPQNITPDIVQNDLVVTTQGGTITVGEQGMSGAMTTLDMVAKQININGQVDNTNAGRRNAVRLSPGSSVATLDTSLSPANPQRPMAQITQSVEANDAVIVSIGEKGGIRAGTIDIAITEAGAGFKHAGSMAALGGDFTLTSSGNVEIEGGTIQAGDDLSVHAKNIKIQSRVNPVDASRAELVAGQGEVHLKAQGQIVNQGGVIQGNKRNENREDSVAAVTLEAKRIINRSISADYLAAIFGVDDDVLLKGDEITNNTGRLVSNNMLYIEAQTSFFNGIDVPEFEGKGELETIERDGKRLWYTLFLKKEKIIETRIKYGDERIVNTVAHAVGKEGISISTSTMLNHGGEINSDNGDVTIAAASVHNKGEIVGEMEHITKCGFGCSRNGSSSIKVLGGKINAGNKLVVEANESVNNEGGQLFAINGLTINSPDVVTSAYTLTFVHDRDRAFSSFQHDDARIYRQDQGGSIISNMGELRIDSLRAVQNTGGSIEVNDDEGEVIITAGVNTLREPIDQSPVFGEAVGLFESWLD